MASSLYRTVVLVIDNIESRESGPAHMDRTGERWFSAVDSEARIARELTEAAEHGVLTHYLPCATTQIYIAGQYIRRNATLAEVLENASGYGDLCKEAMETLVLISRSGNWQAKEMVDKLINKYAAQHAEGDE